MIISTGKIKYLRQQKGWTQQHLADASGLSLRTIQRLEKEGKAANETVQCLCATFNISREDLSIIPRVDESQMQTITSFKTLWMALSIFVAGGILGSLSTYFFL